MLKLLFQKNCSNPNSFNRNAAIHQFGGKAGKNKKVEIPARTYLSLLNNHVDKIKLDIEKYFS